MQIIENVIFNYRYTRMGLLTNGSSRMPYSCVAMENTNSMLDKSKELPMYANYNDCGGLYIGADWTHGYAPLGFERGVLYA